LDHFLKLRIVQHSSNVVDDCEQDWRLRQIGKISRQEVMNIKSWLTFDTMQTAGIMGGLIFAGGSFLLQNQSLQASNRIASVQGTPFFRVFF
jgi:hypothetical protein